MRSHYVVVGPPRARPLVLASSLGTTHHMWAPQMPVLGASYRVIAYDHRGHGGSAAPPGPYSLEDLGRDVLQLLDELELPSVGFCGLSLGGMVGMWLAANAPHRIESLALCSTSAWLGGPAAWHDRAARVADCGACAVADEVLARWFSEGFRERHPRVVAAYGAMLAATPAAGYAGCCAAIAEMDLREELCRIRCPTTVLMGAADPATPPSHGEAIARGIPGARLIVVPDAAHLANVERAAEVSERLLEHLDRSLLS